MNAADWLAPGGRTRRGGLVSTRKNSPGVALTPALSTPGEPLARRLQRSVGQCAPARRRGMVRCVDGSRTKVGRQDHPQRARDRPSEGLGPAGPPAARLNVQAHVRYVPPHCPPPAQLTPGHQTWSDAARGSQSADRPRRFGELRQARRSASCCASRSARACGTSRGKNSETRTAAPSRSASSASSTGFGASSTRRAPRSLPTLGN